VVQVCAEYPWEGEPHSPWIKFKTRNGLAVSDALDDVDDGFRLLGAARIGKMGSIGTRRVSLVQSRLMRPSRELYS